MIPIKNIYYMLAYVFDILNYNSYEKLETEEFGDALELFAEIIFLTLSKQLKRNLDKDYIKKTEDLAIVRGKININNSIKLIHSKKLVCEYDDFTINSYKNRIIKSTINLLLKSNISKKRKKKLKSFIFYLKEVDLIDLNTVNWNLKYNRNNKTYMLIISVCQLIYEGLLPNQSKGNLRIKGINEDNMARLYEKFVLEYYKKEFPDLKPNASYIKWHLDDESYEYLPRMKSDITLTNDYQTLIIDTKYYNHMMQEHYNKKSIHSSNIYQIFTYVKNKKFEDLNKKVSGMLLYAKTDEDIELDKMYKMSGNNIFVENLNLNVSFDKIKEQLNSIILKTFKRF